MTYYNIINAVPSFQKLVHKDLPLQSAYRFAKIVRKVNEELEFYRERSDVDGADELLNFEIDWDEEKIEIPITTDIELSCADVEALEPFITFSE